ncbi:phosphonate ABC transporter permease [Anopheles sinensis]|uniref:Phosphonate ABC transporter permease n=1 Tax=Anopheles sinensis TaxID=74873 RepID=A0A084VBS4_ANOSI|nr:phosphonate ABC transporter permease [Anopheles sinensis]
MMMVMMVIVVMAVSLCFDEVSGDILRQAGYGGRTRLTLYLVNLGCNKLTVVPFG